MTGFEYVFPAIRGVQARREYYVSMCPLRLLPKVFLFNEAEMVPELRAQRQLNKARLPEMARYINDNPDDYVFSAITASIDAEVKFEPLGSSGDASSIGILKVPMNARFVINDGQHRRAAIEMAIREKPAIADESIAVVFFLDLGLERCQQMFADLNRHALRPSRSLGVLYDHRDDKAKLAKLVVARSPVFRDVVEMEKTNLSPRSRRLFTLSAIYMATAALLTNVDLEGAEVRAKLAADYWEEVAKHMKEWEMVRQGMISAGEVREDFIHSHAVVLQALGRMGNCLMHLHPDDWQSRLKVLETIDWHRKNSTLWEGRALIGGRVSKAEQNVILTTNAIKQHLSLPLSPEEQRLEDGFRRGDYVR
ncbi:DNA sulfur modification protein DndB [Magnetospirillum sp. SS-4]|uniref:DNA sulfur modification protein DndB n=1 Tax=Magnetospirillum sp. SS-4 TaxID=2681465 RepID=UPI00137DD549|nr:DNA sulfur modification protein DndB [Magnetospirillum sp. SS-4]CAA7615163.1 DNA sulfur modification protein DndB [Magnetospirillum sp. SS-4]